MTNVGRVSFMLHGFKVESLEGFYNIISAPVNPAKFFIEEFFAEFQCLVKKLQAKPAMTSVRSSMSSEKTDMILFQFSFVESLN